MYTPNEEFEVYATLALQTSNVPELNDRFVLELQDSTSGTKFLSLIITPDTMAKLMGGRGMLQCAAKLRGIDNIGTHRHNASWWIPDAGILSKERENGEPSELDRHLAEHGPTPVQWSPRRQDYGNNHLAKFHNGVRGYLVAFFAFGPEPQPESERGAANYPTQH